ncbi:T9SS type B sorting domain-containing protein [Nibribacter ruber]|uniref:T9SS type B sorting domain-containing protein n=1 Tax=Nibribacter ruber TaxID=2698458 RepID=A0A6P1P234_9BACT|nr:gliding motility-associated C-terminal domain-containing protein [Nibribacter ruber]QHL88453.1 T9SS type B sorting domain-containing protein [Nibribacter ruber]
MHFFTFLRRVASGLAAFCLLCCLLQTASAQRQSNNWYFGNAAGLDFSSGTPSPLLNSAMNTTEGCATFSDQQGNLLFYTDGLTVWNRNHQPMPNGTGLLGNSSTAQAAVVIPAPGKPQQYFVFTNDNNARPNGLRYSIVDMSLAGGLGDVTSKNIYLTAQVSEMLTAIRHPTEQAYWVLAHRFGSDVFLAYKIDAYGIRPGISSSAGGVHSADPAGTGAIGCMKFSPDGTKLAVASKAVGAEVYDFDANTGLVSNAIKVTGIHQGYGTEFSPSGSLLYFTTTGNQQLFQVDLKAGNAAAIAGSTLLISAIGQDGATRYVGGSLQQGPDGKVYVARPTSEHLGVINAPEVRGPGCMYVDRGVYLGGRLSMCGLPVFMQSFFYYDGELKMANTCFGEETTFTLNMGPNSPAPQSTVWEFGDPASGILNSSNETIGNHTFTAPGKYKVKLTRKFINTLEEYTIEFVVQPLPNVNLGPDRQICPGTLTLLDATTSDATAYLWSNGATTPTITTSTPGTYSVQVTSSTGCTQTDEVIVSLLPVPAFDLGANLSLCEGETTVLNATPASGNSFTYLWQDGSTGPTYTVTKPGRYEVKVTNAEGCSTSDAITIAYKPLPLVNLGPDRVLCAQDPLTLGTAQAGASYKWSTGATTATISPAVSGTYWQEVTINGCTSRDEVNVLFNPLPVVNLGPDVTLCLGKTKLMSVERPNATYRWQDGSTLPTFTVTEQGTYWVDVTNEFNCTTRDEIKVYYLTPPTIELGNDTTLCYGDVLTIGKELPDVTYLWSDGSTNATLDVTKPGTYRVTVSLQDICIESDILTIKTKDCVGGLFIPNIFTPNGDGINDNFFIMGLLDPKNNTDVARWELSVYDRWGKRVYYTKDYRNEWEGKGFSDGVYYYHLAHSQDGRLLKGWVEIVR